LCKNSLHLTLHDACMKYKATNLRCCLWAEISEVSVGFHFFQVRVNMKLLKENLILLRTSVIEIETIL